jgi:2-keto-3-deoxy-L-rhamnonate aldolase RhmA
VDWVFLGPVDLAVAMGKIETSEGWRHPEVRSVIADVGRIVRDEGKNVGTLITGPDDLENFDGFNVNVCLGSQLLKLGSDSFLASVKDP